MWLAIMRHGQVPANAAHCYVGALDEDLTPQGRDEARHAGVHPEKRLVYVSPLARARQTASICFPQAEQVVVPDLREMNFGVFEGRSAAEMQDDAAYRQWVESGCVLQCPEGESRAQFTARVARGVTWCCRDALARGLEGALVVAHGGTIMAGFEALCIDDEKQGYFAWQTSNCGGYRAQVSFEDEILRLTDCVPFDRLAFLG